MNQNNPESLEALRTQLESEKCDSVQSDSNMISVSDMIKDDQRAKISFRHSFGTNSPDNDESVSIDPSVEDLDVSNQWYSRDQRIYALEIEAMASLYPNARMGFLKNGSMYWIVRICPNIDKERKNWTLLAIYDKDHPSMKRGGSVSIYPVLPNYEEMLRLINNSCFVKEKIRYIPHTLRDGCGQVFLSLCLPRNEYRSHTKIPTVATYIRYAESWINKFELALKDLESWSRFCGT